LKFTDNTLQLSPFSLSLSLFAISSNNKKTGKATMKKRKRRKRQQSGLAKKWQRRPATVAMRNAIM